MEKPALQFKTSKSISISRCRSLIPAITSLRASIWKTAKQQPKADYVLYGLAALSCLTGHVEEALKTLDEAIHVSPALRFQARNDSDFQNLAEDPRFTELLYPDPGVEAIVPEEEMNIY
jgi:hypothetical protein